MEKKRDDTREREKERSIRAVLINFHFTSFVTHYTSCIRAIGMPAFRPPCHRRSRVRARARAHLRGRLLSFCPSPFGPSRPAVSLLPLVLLSLSLSLCLRSRTLLVRRSLSFCSSLLPLLVLRLLLFYLLLLLLLLHIFLRAGTTANSPA